MSVCCEKGMEKKKILITLRKGGENGGPYVSHMRIMDSCLKDEFEFIPWMTDTPKKMLTPSVLYRNIKLIKDINPDIIHFSGLQLEGFATALTAKLAGHKKTVCAIRGSSLDAMCFAKWKKAVLNLLENRTLKSVVAYYGVSKFVSEWTRLQGYPGARGYVYNLPDFQVSTKTRENMRRELNIPSDAVVVVSTGRITRDKGFAVLTDAILSEKEQWNNVRFLIVGNGDYLEEMQKRIGDSRWRDKVIFTGYRKDIPDLLGASDIFILCTYHETLCNSVLEASYHGLPVISINTGGIPEIVKNEISGFLLQSGDSYGVYRKLRQLIDDAPLRRNLGLAGAQIVRDKFSEAKITSALKDIYNSI